MNKNSAALLALVREKNGRITTKELTERGFRRELPGLMIEEGLLVREGRGVYRLPEVNSDIYLLLQHSCPRAVFSFETALRFHHLITASPAFISITVQQGFNITRLKKICPKLITHYVQPELLELGLSHGTSPEGNSVRLYDQERCICDIIKNQRQVSSEIYIQALQRYFRSDHESDPDAAPKDLRRLQSYAHRYGIEERIYHYMEFLM